MQTVGSLFEASRGIPQSRNSTEGSTDYFLVGLAQLSPKGELNGCSLKVETCALPIETTEALEVGDILIPSAGPLLSNPSASLAFHASEQFFKELPSDIPVYFGHLLIRLRLKSNIDGFKGRNIANTSEILCGYLNRKDTLSRIREICVSGKIAPALSTSKLLKMKITEKLFTDESQPPDRKNEKSALPDGGGAGLSGAALSKYLKEKGYT